MAGLIPRQFIDDLIARTDIVDLIDSRVKLKKAGKSYVACCPFHGEKSPSFHVSQDKQFYHCFGCGASGNVISFLMEYDRLDFVDTIEELASLYNLDVPREESNDNQKTAQQYSIEKQQKLDYYELMSQVSQFFIQQLKTNKNSEAVVEYLKNRGLSGEIAKRFGIGYSPDDWQVVLDKFCKVNGILNTQRQAQLLDTGVLIKNEKGRIYDRFRHRVIFPIRDRRGRVIGFGGRVIDDSTPKYLNSPETPIFHKGFELYGFFEAKQANRDLKRLLVVEGYMDVVALAQHGVSWAVASLGTSTTSEQIQLMFRNTSEIICCYDGDRAGRDAAWRTLQNSLPQLKDGRQIKFMFLPDGEDPDSMIRQLGEQEFVALVDQAMPLSQFLFDNLISQVEMDSEDGRSKLANLALPMVNSISDGVFQQMMKEKLAKYLGMEASSLERFIQAEPESPVKTKRKKASRGSIVRQAIGILVQHPNLAMTLDGMPRLDQIKLKGTELLQQLIDEVHQQPTINAAQLLERWRGKDEYNALLKLASWQHDVVDENLQSHFVDTIVQIINKHLELRLEQLAHKSRVEGLTSEERQEYAQLIANEQ
ncbi:DNA primase [Psychrobium sp. 1_MG-2023]|uniref:DNA primase n=1 Tax=Psychrobium sp. 1_MG-2023 TaxID=3062624 RepID=UPI002735D12E|nr:DNA primase [Psychrobium sp. 1_MG-2023]MDP2560746.1 DNA primase [Psychrobium sp. 1_MG-2023]